MNNSIKTSSDSRLFKIVSDVIRVSIASYKYNYVNIKLYRMSKKLTNVILNTDNIFKLTFLKR